MNPRILKLQLLEVQMPHRGRLSPCSCRSRAGRWWLWCRLPESGRRTRCRSSPRPPRPSGSPLPAPAKGLRSHPTKQTSKAFNKIQFVFLNINRELSRYLKIKVLHRADYTAWFVFQHPSLWQDVVDLVHEWLRYSKFMCNLYLS